VPNHTAFSRTCRQARAEGKRKRHTNVVDECCRQQWDALVCTPSVKGGLLGTLIYSVGERGSGDSMLVLCCVEFARGIMSQRQHMQMFYPPGEIR